MGAFHHVLVAVDFGDSSSRALQLGADVAAACGARLTVVHACDVPAYAWGDVTVAPLDLVTPCVEEAEQRLGALLAPVRARCPEAEAVARVGAAAEQILEEAEARGADLIVLGSHGHGRLAHALLGSVAERVVRGARAAVLTVPSARREAAIAVLRTAPPG